MMNQLNGIVDCNGQKTTLQEGDNVIVKVRPTKIEICLTRNSQSLYWKKSHTDNLLVLQYSIHVGIQVAYDLVHISAIAAGLVAIQTNAGEFKTTDFHFLNFTLQKER